MITELRCPHCGKQVYQTMAFEDIEPFYYCTDCGWIEYPVIYVSFAEYEVSLN